MLIAFFSIKFATRAPWRNRRFAICPNSCDWMKQFDPQNKCLKNCKCIVYHPICIVKVLEHHDAKGENHKTNYSEESGRVSRSKNVQFLSFCHKKTRLLMEGQTQEAEGPPARSQVWRAETSIFQQFSVIPVIKTSAKLDGENTHKKGLINEERNHLAPLQYMWNMWWKKVILN